MRILALIPARGGSKRLADKNIQILGGKPLISWTINVAKEITEICEILVSTDSQQIADIARSNGAITPWLRPNVLATDDAKTIDVALHAVNWYEENYDAVDGLLILQPTSPFRTAKTIRSALKLFEESSYETIIGVSRAEDHPEWMLKFEDNKTQIVPLFDSNGLNKRSQDLMPTFVPNGSIYLIQPKVLRKQRTLYPDRLHGLETESHIESLDIDSINDLMFARFILEEKLVYNPFSS